MNFKATLSPSKVRGDTETANLRYLDVHCGEFETLKPFTKTAIKHGEETPTNKGCRRASREAHERDRIANEIVESRHSLGSFF